MRRFWKQLVTFEGRIDRSLYFLTGTTLVLLKYLIDWSISRQFGQSWAIWNYFLPPRHLGVFGIGATQPRFYAILWAIAIPFFWIGISLTLRRLRDAGLRSGWVFLFFLPIANLLFFLYLSFAPTASNARQLEAADDDANAPPAPYPPLVGVAIAAVLGLAFVLLNANFLGHYGWGLFLGVPFLVGFITSWFYNAARLHSRKGTAALCTLTIILIGFILIGFRLEGLMCLVMAIPLAVPFAVAGGLAAHHCLNRSRPSLTPPRVSACVALFPLLFFAEHAAHVIPPVRPVVTSVTINAPVSVVWKNVIAFPPLDPPKALLFRTGIAYPIGATVVGSGPGAIRYCRFSTGDFIEPITTWDENHLLAFSVSAQPPSMREIGFGAISTPHNDRNYMRSQHGQFRLIALDDQHTLLEGTTWYQDYFWPQIYWRGWSDAIVHRIHLRVLEHVKELSEHRLQ